MFKKVLALTLALVMLLMPMTASAVTWNQLVTGLKTSGGSSYTYNDAENGNTTITSDSMSTTVSGGVLSFEEACYLDYGIYHFEKIDIDNMRVIAHGENVELYLENGAKAGSVEADAFNGGYLMLGVMDGAEVAEDIIVYMGKDSAAAVWTKADSKVKNVEVHAGGKGAYGEVVLNGDSNEVFIGSWGEDAAVNAYNFGKANSLYTSVGEGGVIFATNSGSVENASADIYDDGRIEFAGKGTVENSWVHINVPTLSTYTAEQLLEIVESVNLSGSEFNAALLWVESEDGDSLSLYAIQEDGSLVPIDVVEPEEEEEDNEEPEPEPDPIELQRQAEGIGGVTTSPVWNWQGYLGHSSKPMWIYVNGEKVLMRQRLFWLGDSTKNHTCRINIDEPDPASVELRIGLDMLRTAQRAEISVISILDKEGNPVAQFAVSDLLGAFEQYGLVEGELLCVSGDADAEVMKVTLDGEYLPLEAE